MSHPLEDELAIRHLIAAYADAVNRKDEKLWASTWSKTGAWTLPGTAVEGREAVVELWRGAMGGFDHALQVVYQGTIEIEGDQATGRWYLTEFLQPKGSDKDIMAVGTYADEYIREDGEWRFKSRAYHVLYTAEGTPGAFTPLP